MGFLGRHPSVSGRGIVRMQRIINILSGHDLSQEKAVNVTTDLGREITSVDEANAQPQK